MSDIKYRYLYFVKFENRTGGRDTIVFLLTAQDDGGAEAAGRNLIDPRWANDYALLQVDVVCTTPDEVRCFEPV